MLVGSDTDDYAFTNDAGADVVMKFTDNSVVNGSGADLAVYELGIPDAFDLGITVGGTTHFYVTAATGATTSGGYSLNVAEVNLDDFGVPAGGSINTIQVYEDQAEGEAPSLTAFGAINSGTVPEPASAAVLGLAGPAALLGRRRRA